MFARPRSFTRSSAACRLTLFSAWAIICGCACEAWAAPQPPQAPPAGQEQPLQPLPLLPVPTDRPLRVFIDCTNTHCDTEYFRTELLFVDHVRDRRDADVHVLVTGNTTGGGGTEYTFAFIGVGPYEKVNQTLRCVTRATDTNDERRRAMLATLKLGLVRYAADTPAGQQLEIGYRRGTSAGAATAPARDPWNFWVFNVNLRGTTRGETSQTAVSMNGSLSANRVTEEWKILSSVSGNYSRSDYTFSEGDTYTSISRGYFASALIVNSLGRHWGAGVDTAFGSSTYSNLHDKVRIAPAVEYNVFPYSESTRRQLTVNYAVGYSSARYFETTVYGKDEDSLPDHAVTVMLDLRQPWGTTGVSFQMSQYLNDLSKNRMVVDAEMDVRLFKGFSVTAWGSASRIRDQLNLPMGEATQEEVLVRQRQLATSYDYYLSVGVSYRFGSIFNNVVNTRFNGARQPIR